MHMVTQCTWMHRYQHFLSSFIGITTLSVKKSLFPVICTEDRGGGKLLLLANTLL